jgi:ribosome biogenesis GTPase A
METRGIFRLEGIMIQWFPGHMAKAKKEIEERLRIVDIVFELVDARIPHSSKNPLFASAAQQKPKLMLLTKCDLADSRETKKWADYYHNLGYAVLEIDSLSGFHINAIVKNAEDVLKDKREKERAKGLKERPIRAMIIGIPNVGKSTLINTLVKKKSVKVANRPGVTLAQQWVRINQNLDLLDTPGVLWPKFEEESVGIHLALTGAIRDEVLPIIDLGEYLLSFLKEHYPFLLSEKYGVDPLMDNSEIVREIAKSRGLVKEDFYEQALRILIYDFRNNRIGRVTLDRFSDALLTKE